MGINHTWHALLKWSWPVIKALDNIYIISEKRGVNWGHDGCLQAEGCYNCTISVTPLIRSMIKVDSKLFGQLWTILQVYALSTQPFSINIRGPFFFFLSHLNSPISRYFSQNSYKHWSQIVSQAPLHLKQKTRNKTKENKKKQLRYPSLHEKFILSSEVRCLRALTYIYGHAPQNL